MLASLRQELCKAACVHLQVFVLVETVAHRCLTFICLTSKRQFNKGKQNGCGSNVLRKKVLGAPKPYRFFQYPFLDNITHPWTHPSLVFFEHDPQKSNLLLIHHGWSPFSLLETIWFHGTFGCTIIVFPFSLLETMISCDFGIQHRPFSENPTGGHRKPPPSAAPGWRTCAASWPPRPMVVTWCAGGVWWAKGVRPKMSQSQSIRIPQISREYLVNVYRTMG